MVSMSGLRTFDVAEVGFREVVIAVYVGELFHGRRTKSLVRLPRDDSARTNECTKM